MQSPQPKSAGAREPIRAFHPAFALDGRMRNGRKLGEFGVGTAGWRHRHRRGRVHPQAAAAEASFCATGGIEAADAPDDRALPNAACVGGSWVAPAPAVAAGAWPHIQALAAEASRLRG